MPRRRRTRRPRGGSPPHAGEGDLSRPPVPHFPLDLPSPFSHPSHAMADDASPAPETPGRSNRVKTLVLCCSIHFLHDGCANALYVRFPLIALDLHLSFAQVGSLKTAYSWAMSALQIPASLRPLPPWACPVDAIIPRLEAKPPHATQVSVSGSLGKTGPPPAIPNGKKRIG